MSQTDIWLIASPKQRLVILKALDSIKRTSEEIRNRANKFNPHLTRISTKAVLKELTDKGTDGLVFRFSSYEN